MTLASLHRRVQRFGHQGLALRPRFHHLIVVTRGTLTLSVDFTPHVARAGEWLWIRPGQVNEWGDLAAAQGILVLFEDAAVDRRTAGLAEVDDRHAPALVCPPPADASFLRRCASLLLDAFEQRGELPAAVSTAALGHVLATLLVRLGHVVRAAQPAGGSADEAFRRFRDAVEQDFARTRRVEDYAARLGWSPRTLTRATAEAAGVSAKRFVDDRVVLEARRLLVHTDRSVAQIAADLGFSSPTNFTKFFRKATGQPPAAFRTAFLERHAPA